MVTSLSFTSDRQGMGAVPQQDYIFISAAVLMSLINENPYREKICLLIYLCLFYPFNKKYLKGSLLRLAVQNKTKLIRANEMFHGDFV